MVCRKLHLLRCWWDLKAWRIITKFLVSCNPYPGQEIKSNQLPQVSLISFFSHYFLRLLLIAMLTSWDQISLHLSYTSGMGSTFLSLRQVPLGPEVEISFTGTCTKEVADIFVHCSCWFSSSTRKTKTQ